jgi:hypothetical protein
MADENDWKPGDDTNVILRKILTRLANLSSGGGGSGGAVTVTSGNIIVDDVVGGNIVVDDVVGGNITVDDITDGNVGGFSTSIKDTTAVSASPDYSIGDAVGGKRTLASAVRVSGGTAILEDIILLDRANQGPGLEILFFDADPTSATITDNSGFVFSTDDLKLIARVTIGQSDWTSLNSKKYAHIKSIGALLKAASGTSLYVAIVATTAYNAAATDDMQVIYKFLQD